MDVAKMLQDAREQKERNRQAAEIKAVEDAVTAAVSAIVNGDTPPTAQTAPSTTADNTQAATQQGAQAQSQPVTQPAQPVSPFVQGLVKARALEIKRRPYPGDAWIRAVNEHASALTEVTGLSVDQLRTMLIEAASPDQAAQQQGQQTPQPPADTQQGTLSRWWKQLWTPDPVNTQGGEQG